jgi:tetratricopeptide (TPR) repeat protein
VRLGDAAGEARTLLAMGNLYDAPLNLPDDAIDLYRQAGEISAGIGDAASEGRARGNLAVTLCRLKRLDEAHREILRAIECGASFGHVSEPWTNWSIRATIESARGDPTAAADARGKAVAAYLTFRRDGGENHYADGRIAHAVTRAWHASDSAAAASLLRQLAARPDLQQSFPFIHTLQSIVAGNRTPTVAETTGLNITMAAECLLLIETLEAH